MRTGSSGKPWRSLRNGQESADRSRNALTPVSVACMQILRRIFSPPDDRVHCRPPRPAIARLAGPQQGIEAWASPPSQSHRESSRSRPTTAPPSTFATLHWLQCSRGRCPGSGSSTRVGQRRAACSWRPSSRRSSWACGSVVARWSMHHGSPATPAGHSSVRPAPDWWPCRRSCSRPSCSGRPASRCS